MTAQTLTALSGVVLLLVFGLVGWNLRRRRGPRARKPHSSHEETP